MREAVTRVEGAGHDHEREAHQCDQDEQLVGKPARRGVEPRPSRQRGGLL